MKIATLASADRISFFRTSLIVLTLLVPDKTTGRETDRSRASAIMTASPGSPGASTLMFVDGGASTMTHNGFGPVFGTCRASTFGNVIVVLTRKSAPAAHQHSRTMLAPSE